MSNPNRNSRRGFTDGAAYAEVFEEDLQPSDIFKNAEKTNVQEYNGGAHRFDEVNFRHEQTAGSGGSGGGDDSSTGQNKVTNTLIMNNATTYFGTMNFNSITKK